MTPPGAAAAAAVIFSRCISGKSFTKLGIADLLASAPQTIEHLAERTNSHAPSLYRVMRTLAGIGIFRESGDRTFELTAASQMLRRFSTHTTSRAFAASWMSAAATVR